MPRCEHCPERITWLQTKAGKKMPCEIGTVHVLDVEPQPGEDTFTVLTLADRAVLKHAVMCDAGVDGAIAALICHWFNCPGASQARKPRPGPVTERPAAAAAVVDPAVHEAAVAAAAIDPAMYEAGKEGLRQSVIDGAANGGPAAVLMIGALEVMDAEQAGDLEGLRTMLDSMAEIALKLRTKTEGEDVPARHPESFAAGQTQASGAAGAYVVRAAEKLGEVARSSGMKAKQLHLVDVMLRQLALDFEKGLHLDSDSEPTNATQQGEPS